MTVAAFDPVLHAPLISGWCRDRGMSDSMLRLFPESGFVADEMVAGFLYRTDSPICLLEGFISDPKVSKERRAIALDALGEALLTLAKEEGFQTVWAFTSRPSIIDLALRHGFRLSPDGYQFALKQL